MYVFLYAVLSITGVWVFNWSVNQRVGIIKVLTYLNCIISVSVTINIIIT